LRTYPASQIRRRPAKHRETGSFDLKPSFIWLICAASLEKFASANFQPMFDLTAFTGITGVNKGNFGRGNFFDFVAGHIESGPGCDWVIVAALGTHPERHFRATCWSVATTLRL
jgi:hypothetical protein